MAGAIDEDTARTIASGRETVGAVLSSAQSQLKKVFLVFVGAMVLTIWALYSFLWDTLKRDLLYNQLSGEVLDNTTIVAVTPFDVPLLQVKIGIIVGVIVTIPVLLWVGRDGLRRRGLWPSQKVARWKVWLAVALIVFLAIGGALYAYELFFPLMFAFLAGNAVQAGFTPTYSIVKWTEFVVFLSLSFALAAQLPLLMSSLAASGIVKYETFRDKWRIAVVAIFAFGALFSPPDPFTQIMWAVPLVTLYAISLGITKLVVVSLQAGEHVPIRGVVRDRWNLLAGTLVLVAGAVYAFLTRGGLSAVNDALAWAGSRYRAPTTDELGLFGLGPETTAVLAGLLVGLVAGLVALFYFRLVELERLTVEESGPGVTGTDATAGATDPTGDAATTAPSTAASAGEPAEIDIDALSTAAVRAAPPEAFATLTEEEALQHAQRAMEADDAEKAQLILDRFDEAEDLAVEPEAGADGDSAGQAQETDDEGNVVTSTAAGMMDAFTEDETTEDDVGGYYYDLAFILESLTSKAIWLVGTFMVVMAGTFIFLYQGGIKRVNDAFLAGMPAALEPQVDIALLHPVEALIFEIKVATLLGVVAVLPLVVYFAWPAIEKRGFASGDRSILAVWGGSLVVAVIGGSLVGFFYVAPAVISWLAQDALQAGMLIKYRVNNYGWLIIFTTVGIGLLAEIPVTMFLFHRGGIVSYGTMRRRWRVVVVGLFAAGGLLSPKGTFTMFLLALPAAFAYGVGLAILWLYTRITGVRAQPKGEAAD
ncbi:twin-arginine translocase subunit TatC [Halobacteriales archaeon Cl-PHB]